MNDSSDALPDGVTVLGELLDRAVVDHEHRQADRVAERLEAHAAGGRLLGAAEQAVVRLLERSARRGRRRCRAAAAAWSARPPRGSRRARPDPGSARRRPARRAQPGSRPPPAASCSGCRSRRARRRRGERQQERHRLRLEVDAGADRQPAERLRPLELARRSPRAAGSCSITHSIRRSSARLKTKGPRGALRSQYQLGLRRGASGRLRRRVNASPPRWLGGSRQVTGTRLYELVPPLPVLEVSNAGPPPFRGYPQSSGWVRTDATPFALPRRRPAPSSPRGGR